MKVLLLLGVFFMTACSSSGKSTVFYSFNEIDYAHELEQEPMESVPVIQLKLEENGKVINQNNVDNTNLHVNVTNTSTEILEIGPQVDIERYSTKSWEKVNPPESLTEETVLIQFHPNEEIEYIIPIKERFLENDELVGGTYRLNNNNQYFAYFFIAEFSNEVE